MCGGVSQLPSCCAGALSCLKLLSVYGVGEGGSRTGASSEPGLHLSSKMHLGNRVHGRFECGHVELKAGGTSRQSLSEPRVSKLHFTALQHTWSWESSLQKVSIGHGAARPPVSQALVCQACAFVHVGTPACMLVPPLALARVPMSCCQRGAVLCRCHCGGAKASLQLSEAAHGISWLFGAAGADLPSGSRRQWVGSTRLVQAEPLFALEKKRVFRKQRGFPQ